jgi:hypothetical protein
MSENRGHTLSGLITKRAEIAGEITHIRAKLRQLIIDLGHVDAAIRIFDPDFDIDGIKPKQPMPLYNVSFRGEFVRIILDMMREAQGPVTTKEIATARHAGGCGLNITDAALVALVPAPGLRPAVPLSRAWDDPRSAGQRAGEAPVQLLGVDCVSGSLLPVLFFRQPSCPFHDRWVNF